MKRIKLSIRHRFIALLLLVILNKRILFAAASPRVVSTAREQKQPDMWRDDARVGSHFDIHDQIEAFLALQYIHQIPKNFSLLKEEEVAVFIGCMGAGKTTLTGGFAGYTLESTQAGQIDIEEAKSSEVVANKYSKNKLGKIGHEEVRFSCTKMPNILLNEKMKGENLVFVDCPGFDDDSPEQGLFIQASVQIIARNIKKLKAILCVIEKEELHQGIRTLQHAKKHKLNNLVIYLMKFLEEPLKYCRKNLLLVVNKTGGEYTLVNAQKILGAHCDSLNRIKEACKENDKEQWEEHGEPILNFVNIFLHQNYGPQKIICMNNVTDPSNFELAIHKIEKITTFVERGAIKIALSPQDQETLIKIMLSISRLAALNHTYEVCKKKLYEEARAKERKARADARKLQRQASDKQQEFEKSRGFQIVRCIGYVLGVVVIIVARLQSNESTINEILGMGFLLAVMVSLDHLAGPSQAPFQQAFRQAKAFKQAIKLQEPSRQAIKNAVSLTENGRNVVGKDRGKAKFYYELCLLGAKLKQHPVLEIYIEAFESLSME